MKITSYTDRVEFDLASKPEANIQQIEVCPMCDTLLSVELNESIKNYYIDHEQTILSPLSEPVRLLRCSECGWWGIEEKDSSETYVNYHRLISAVSRWYDVTSKNIPVSVLRDYLKKEKKTDFKLLHPWAFERLIAECLRHEFGPCEVHHVGVSGGGGDGGVDIFMIKDEVTWLIQVKRRLNDKSEPIETIRLLNGVLLREGKYNGMVVTSAESFSGNVVTETRLKTPGPYIVRLINRGDVLDMFSKVPSYGPEDFLKEQFPIVIQSPLSDEMLLLLGGKIPKEESNP